jgi:hypothetical protein
MKNVSRFSLVSLTLLVFVVACASPLPVTSEKLKLSKRLVSSLFVDQTRDKILQKVLKVSVESFVDNVRNNPALTEGERKALPVFEAAVRSFVHKNLDEKFFRKKSAYYYAQKLTKKDLEDAVQFFGTSAGKKYGVVIALALDELSVTEQQKKTLFGDESYRTIEVDKKRGAFDYEKIYRSRLTEEEMKDYMRFARSSAGLGVGIAVRDEGEFLGKQIHQMLQSQQLKNELRQKLGKKEGAF